MLDLGSDPICNSAGCTQYKHAAAAADPPRDYFVPHFGEDPDMVATRENEALASKMIAHKWGMGTERHFEEYRNKALDTKYNYNPSLDSDVVNTLSHAASAETSTGNTWGA